MGSKIIKNSLGYDSSLYVYQDKEMFNYSIDSILLGNFVLLTNQTKKIFEVGVNNGALSIFIAARKDDLKIEGIEIQEKAYKLGLKNIKLNNFDERISLIHGDFKDFAISKDNFKKYDQVVANPPFYQVKNFRKPSISESKYEATHEVNLDLETLVKLSAKILKTKGYLTFVIPTERSVDAFYYLKKYDFEAKRVQFVYPRVNSKSNLILIEARFQAGWGPFFLPNIYLHNDEKDNKKYRAEVKELYKPIKFSS